MGRPERRQNNSGLFEQGRESSRLTWPGDRRRSTAAAYYYRDNVLPASDPLFKTVSADSPAANKARKDMTREIAANVAYGQIVIVNVVSVDFLAAGDGGWILIDTGIAAAIVLTHGHFDHLGSLDTFAQTSGGKTGSAYVVTQKPEMHPIGKGRANRCRPWQRCLQKPS